ncbi:aspartate aminotransferase family protein [Magnetospira sp. QH-2]|uniref:aspartate aminotransferase family protein n=1 Tax=Magnetospira sp. (strain QH-2) TaxID=1288970 RepID=UPI0003E81AFC|nr:aspartate aminotransferase family protein [Magnetospira sp. QH-2]CCQ73232.1 Aminotransferase [Magnetospira sp. QH-2]
MSPIVNSAAARDQACYLHPYTNLKTHQETGPLIIERGQGVRVFDDEGRAYIEGLGGLWCTSLGFSEPRLVEAATKAMQTLPFYHGFGHKSSPATIDLAEKLLSLAPVPLSKVLFANSGSESNDTAIKLIWYFNNARGRPEKKKIIARHKGYHGVTVASGSLTGLPPVQMDFDLPIDRILHTDCPHHYRFAEDGESEEDFASRLADNLETLILDEGPDTVAAFFAEPVMGAGGVLTPPATYFEKIQAVLTKYDVLLVADEVICGFGRTGNMFGCQTYDIKPDMITLAKGLSSGYLPISALMVSEEIYQAMVGESEKIGVFGHGYTYGGHPVPAAVALETLRIYEERDIVGQVRRTGPHLHARLEELADHPLVGQVRGVGLLGAVELMKDKATRTGFEPSDGVGAFCANRSLAHGLIHRAMGDSLAFSPPLIISEAEIDEMVGMFKIALDETHHWARAQGLVT